MSKIGFGLMPSKNVRDAIERAYPDAIHPNICMFQGVISKDAPIEHLVYTMCRMYSEVGRYKTVKFDKTVSYIHGGIYTLTLSSKCRYEYVHMCLLEHLRKYLVPEKHDTVYANEVEHEALLKYGWRFAGVAYNPMLALTPSDKIRDDNLLSTLNMRLCNLPAERMHAGIAYEVNADGSPGCALFKINLSDYKREVHNE